MRQENIISPITRDVLEIFYINRFKIEELKTESYEKMEYIGQTIEEKVKMIIKNLGYEIKVRNFYAYIVREIIRNVPEHSQSESFELICYRNKNEFAFRVIDKGITIRNSLNTNPKFDIIDDKSSVLFAIKPGVTKSYKRDPNRDDVWQNSGFGLYMVSTLMEKMGYFELRSGSGKVIIMKGKDIESKSVNRTLGTEVFVVIDNRVKIDISNTLKEISSKGSRFAKTSNFASYADKKTASQASTLIEQ